MSSDKPSIKIFVSTHKDHVHFPDNELIKPIQVGCALHGTHFPGMLHDDEGDNISSKNASYCELTAQYWAWKHEDADYFGFMHYRRYFSFSNRHFKTNYFGDVFEDINDEKTLKKMLFDEEHMRAKIEPYDFVVSEPGSFVDGQTMRQQYDSSWEQKSEDLDCVLDIIRERHPEFTDAAERYLNQTEGYFCNMFIMKREIFRKYSEWLFDILEEHEKRRDISDYDITSYRVSGYLSERLCGIYITRLKEQGYTYTTLQRVLFRHVEAVEHLSPIFEDKNPVTVVFSANDYYVPYLAALLQSIKDASSSQRYYDLIVLTQNISFENQAQLKHQVEAGNISLRFLGVFRAMHDYQDKLFIRGHFKVETYFRLLLPQLLPDYHKVLYLDSDMIALRDVAELFDENVEGYLVAACKDPDTAGLYNGAAPHKKEYIDSVLKLKEPYSYFQAGTILFNLDTWRSTYTPNEIFAFASSYEWELLDQDVLNYLCQGYVKFVPMDWNVMMNWRGVRLSRIISRAPRDMYFAYVEAHKHPAIAHFAGPDKPWDIPSADMAPYFWRFSRKTVYYEEALARMAHENAQKERSLTPKEFIYQRMITPVVQKAFPEKTKGFEKLRSVYRKVNPKKNDIF